MRKHVRVSWIVLGLCVQNCWVNTIHKQFKSVKHLNSCHIPYHGIKRCAWSEKNKSQWLFTTKQNKTTCRWQSLSWSCRCYQHVMLKFNTSETFGQLKMKEINLIETSLHRSECYGRFLWDRYSFWSMPVDDGLGWHPYSLISPGDKRTAPK